MQVAIVGMGESGLGALALCRFLGYSALCFDSAPEKGYPDFCDMPPEVDMVVVSPGIRVDRAPFCDVPCIGEVEFAVRHLPAEAKCIGITGTNGKTTVTELSAHILRFCGIKAVACGNNGFSLSRALVAHPKAAVYVVEMSSYQLETLQTAALDAAAITNIAPDHLDRYATFEAYARVKCSIASYLRKGRYLYAPHSVSERWGLAADSGAEDIADENVRAACALSRHCNCSMAQCLKAVRTFKRPPHRLEYIAAVSGVTFYDDSKATNVAAVVFALNRVSAPIVLIAGGRGKGEPFTPLCVYGDRLRAVIAIGEARRQIYEDLSPGIVVCCALSLEAAVEKAYHMAECGDVVILSPGCSSFDMFTDYTHRGRRYQEIVHNVKESLYEST